MKTPRALAAVAVAVCAVATPGQAYLSSYPSYETMAAQSDLVVIATPVSRQELKRDAQLPGVLQGGVPIRAIEIETTFRTLVALAGQAPPADATLVLVHYRERQGSAGLRSAGPMLIDFRPGDNTAYLMFLKRRGDGRFEAFHEVEPGWCIVKLPHPSGR